MGLFSTVPDLSPVSDRNSFCSCVCFRVYRRANDSLVLQCMPQSWLYLHCALVDTASFGPLSDIKYTTADPKTWL